MESESYQQKQEIGKSKQEDDFKCANLSNTGLTMVPSTLFQRHDITRLDLSDNNIKSLPAEIVYLKNLQHMNLCRNGFHCSSVDDTSIFPQAMRNLRLLHYLNISECNLSFVPATIWEITSLKQLDISRNNIAVLPPNVGNLDNLEWFNAQHTGLKSLPQEIIGCEKLETLLLYGNIIQTLPYLLPDISNLQYLLINLRHLADAIDSNMESLLRSGQILSDHISNTLFDLPKIKIIELEFCKINYFKKLESKNLEELYLQGNFFKMIPDSVLSLEKLQILDLSNNLLISISDDIIKLENVKILLLRANKLESLSSNIFQMKSLVTLDISSNKLKEINIPELSTNTCLETLKINHNLLQTLPATIVNLKALQDLDVTSNKLSEIPIDLYLMTNIKSAHTFKGLYKIGLWLLKNPIEFPPKSIWNTTSIEKIYQFLKRTKIKRLQRKMPVRVVLLEENNHKKTLFLDKFLNKNVLDNFQYLSINQWMSPNSVPFVFININCHEIYSMHLRHFIEDNSLIWIFIKHGDPVKQIKKWLQIVVDYSNDCVIQFLMIHHTKMDSNFDCDENDVPSKLKTEIDDYKNNFIKELQKDFNKTNLKILPRVFEIFLDESLNSFKEELEYIAIDSSLFEADRFCYLFNTETKEIEKICKNFPCIYINKNDLITDVKQFMLTTTENIETCLKILHKKGKLLWFSKSEKLSEKIYPFITVFSKAIYSLLRPSYDEDLDFFKNPLIKAEGLMNNDLFESILNNFKNYGEISYPLYKILTFELKKLHEIKDFMLDADLAWIAPISEIPEENIYDRPYVVLPQFNKLQCNKDYFLQEVIRKNEDIHIDCSLLLKSSSDLFLNLRCAINAWAIRRFDWKDVVYLYHEDGDITLFKQVIDDSRLVIHTMVRLWSNTQLDLLPCGGNFKIWIKNWCSQESKCQNNLHYDIVEVKIERFDEYIIKYMKD